MWNPALEFAEPQPCRVEGWRRSFCFWTPLGRGTPELPGLMLALERGGACEGIAYRLAPDQVESELAILWNREMLAGIYQAAMGADEAARRAHRDRRHLRGRPGALPVLRRPADGAGRPITSPSPRAAAAPAATISPTPPPMPARSASTIPTSRSMVERVAHLRGEDVAPSVPPLAAG